MDWICLVKYTGLWRTQNSEHALQVLTSGSTKKRIYRLAERLSASQGLGYVETAQKEYTVRQKFRDTLVSVKNSENFCQ